MSKWKAFITAGFSLFLSTALFAEIPKDIESKIRHNFKASLPSLKIDTIAESPIPKLYEVISGPVVMYVTEDGHYAISGDILDLKDGETNITENARKKARLQALNKLGTARMIIYPAKDQKYQITVFTDLDCVYCRKFHSQMKQINKLGITVRYLPFPRGGAKSSSYDKAISVWCADDKKGSLTNAKQGQPVQPLTCATHKVDEAFHLGVMTGVTGTPTLILQDGTLLPGYYSPEALLHVLKETSKTKKA